MEVGRGGPSVAASMPSRVDGVRAYDGAGTAACGQFPPNAVGDTENRHLQRSSSRKSMESNPEDGEYFVSEDGVIMHAVLDDQARIQRLKQLLARREKETRQAAEYGLSLLETNEELELQVATLKIQLDTTTSEFTAERETYMRRHEHALLDIENWKRKHARLEEELYEMGTELEQVLGRCQCHNEQTPSSQQQARIEELESALAELQANEGSSSVVIEALKTWKASVEAAQREKENSEVCELTSERLYIQKLETDVADLRRTADEIAEDRSRVADALRQAESLVKQMRKETEDLHDELSLKRRENGDQLDLLHTSEAKCSRLQRELALMEHISYLSMAVIDHDDEEDDDDDDEEVDGSREVTRIRHAKGVSKATDTTTNRKSTIEDMFDLALAEEEQTPRTRQKRGLSAAAAAFTTYHAPGATSATDNQNQVPPTPSSLATHQKLHHYFHLTAQSIIHENNLAELCFDSSSRSTIDAWYRQIIDEAVPFLDWHTWLINRIRSVAASFQNEQNNTKRSGSSGSSSPFRAFARRVEHSLQSSSSSSPASTGVAPLLTTPPILTPPTPRVSFSVAQSFFRLLGRRDTDTGLD